MSGIRTGSGTRIAILFFLFLLLILLIINRTLFEHQRTANTPTVDEVSLSRRQVISLAIDESWPSNLFAQQSEGLVTPEYQSKHHSGSTLQVSRPMELIYRRHQHAEHPDGEYDDGDEGSAEEWKGEYEHNSGYDEEGYTPDQNISGKSGELKKETSDRKDWYNDDFKQDDEKKMISQPNESWSTPASGEASAPMQNISANLTSASTYAPTDSPSTQWNAEMSSYTSVAVASSMPTNSTLKAYDAPLLPPFLKPAAGDASLSAQKVTLITGQVMKAREKALDAVKVDALSSNSLLTWLAPRAGDAFATSDQITLQWSLPTLGSFGFQIRLCVLRAILDLQNAHSGIFGPGACGSSMQVTAVMAASGTGSQVSLGAPSVFTAETFFVVLSPSSALQSHSSTQKVGSTADAIPVISNRAPSGQQHKRDAPPITQLISPPFVLAPHGVDLSMVNALPSVHSASVDYYPPELNQQGPAQPDLDKERPVKWAWVALPLSIVCTILIVCALIYSHRRGRKIAQDNAITQMQDVENRWREATQREVDELAKSAVNQAVLLSSAATGFQARPRSESYRYPSSNLSVMCESKDGSRRAPTYDQQIPRHSIHVGPLTVHRADQRPDLLYESGPSLATRLPYYGESNSSWETGSSAGESTLPLLTRQESVSSVGSSSVPALPVPAALRPQSSFSGMVNPHEESNRPRALSTPLIAMPLERQRSSRILSYSAAERSTRSGKIGTAYQSVGAETVQRANEANDLYQQLRQALQAGPTRDTS